MLIPKLAPLVLVLTSVAFPQAPQAPAVLDGAQPAAHLDTTVDEYATFPGDDVPGYFQGFSANGLISANLGLTWTNTSAAARTVELVLDLGVWLEPQNASVAAAALSSVVPTVFPDPPPVFIGDLLERTGGPVTAQPGQTVVLILSTSQIVGEWTLLPLPTAWDGTTLLIGQVGQSPAQLREAGVEVTDGIFSWAADDVDIGSPLGWSSRIMFDPAPLAQVTTCSWAGQLSISGEDGDLWAEISNLSVAQAPLSFLLLESMGQGALGPGGILCLDWPIRRHHEVSETIAGVFFDWTYPLDVPGWLPGETRHFQVWYRDGTGLAQVTDSVAATL